MRFGILEKYEIIIQTRIYSDRAYVKICAQSRLSLREIKTEYKLTWLEMVFKRKKMNVYDTNIQVRQN